MGRGSCSSSGGSGGGKGAAAVAVEWSLVKRCDWTEPWCDQWTAVASRTQALESRRKKEEPGLMNVCFGDVFGWSFIILVILDK